MPLIESLPSTNPSLLIIQAWAASRMKLRRMKSGEAVTPVVKMRLKARPILVIGSLKVEPAMNFRPRSSDSSLTR
ncbi:hypothetical protein D3C85_1454620 [compost metagenome]